MRANLLCLILFQWKRKVLILNGLGAVREVKVLRLILYFLMWVNQARTHFVIQNARDFRFFRSRFFNVTYICGSGGRKFDCKSLSGFKFVLVTRLRKFEFVYESLIEFLSTNPDSVVNVYGMSECDLPIQLYNKCISNLRFNGYVSPGKFFLEGNVFLQLYGYSEGFPHSLADAILSNCDIVIDKRSFVNLGIYKFVNITRGYSNGFYLLESKDLSLLKENIELVSVNQAYLSCVNKAVSCIV